MIYLDWLRSQIKIYILFYLLNIFSILKQNVAIEIQ